MLKTLKVLTSDLDVGMYVSSLDRSWLETPFLTQGFFIETQEDIARLRQYCDYVWVDSRRSSKKINGPARKVLEKADHAGRNTITREPRAGRPRPTVENGGPRPTVES